MCEVTLDALVEGHRKFVKMRGAYYPAASRQPEQVGQYGLLLLNMAMVAYRRGLWRGTAGQIIRELGSSTERKVLLEGEPV